MTSPRPEANEEKPKYQSFVTGLAVASIPIAGYLVAYCYEKGATDYFRVPDRFMTLDWTNVFVAAGVVAGFLAGVVVVFELLYRILHELPVPAKWRSAVDQFPSEAMIRFLLAAAWVPVAVWATTLPGWVFWTFSSLLILWMVASFVSVITWRLNKQTGKTQTREASISRPVRQTPIGLVARHPAVRGLLVLVAVVIYLAIASYYFGRVSAVRQTEFLIVEAPQEVVVLRSYSDLLICAPFDRESKEIDGSHVIVMKAASDTGTILTREKVGPLKVKQD
jgi:MFS family permease